MGKKPSKYLQNAGQRSDDKTQKKAIHVPTGNEVESNPLMKDLNDVMFQSASNPDADLTVMPESSSDAKSPMIKANSKDGTKRVNLVNQQPPRPSSAITNYTSTPGGIKQSKQRLQNVQKKQKVAQQQ